MTTDDQVCVALLDDAVVRQVLRTRDSDEIAMIVRLNLITSGARDLPSDLLLPAGDRRPSEAVAMSADQCRSQRPTSSTV